MTTRLVVARHGNTFDSGDVVRRVGGRTDLPLSSSGRQQAERLGRHFAEHSLVPTAVFAAPLLRTRQTAELALAAMPCTIAIQPAPQLTEIDYGPDEGMPETAVVVRLGEQALRDWEEKQIVPDGWRVDPAALRKMWAELASRVQEEYCGKTVLCVTSNGIARFALSLAPPSGAKHTGKLATGAYGVFENSGTCWRVASWNVRP